MVELKIVERTDHLSQLLFSERVEGLDGISSLFYYLHFRKTEEISICVRIPNRLNH